MALAKYRKIFKNGIEVKKPVEKKESDKEQSNSEKQEIDSDKNGI
jgi:hypothetical protein